MGNNTESLREEDQANAPLNVSTRISSSTSHALDVLAQIMKIKKADLVRMALDEFIERRTSPEAVAELADAMRDRMVKEAEEAQRRLSNNR